MHCHVSALHMLMVPVVIWNQNGGPKRISYPPVLHIVFQIVYDPAVSDFLAPISWIKSDLSFEIWGIQAYVRELGRNSSIPNCSRISRLRLSKSQQLADNPPRKNAVY